MKEVWLVFKTGVYDHDVYFVAETEEQAVQFTKDYAPDYDGYHGWDIRKKKLGVPDGEGLFRKVGPIWQELERLNPQMTRVIGTNNWRDMYARRNHLEQHLRNGDVVCNCPHSRLRDFRWEQVTGVITQEEDGIFLVHLAVYYRDEFITSNYRLPKSDLRDGGPYWVLDKVIVNVEKLMDEIDKMKEKK